jgi:hypothetical protein
MVSLGHSRCGVVVVCEWDAILDHSAGAGKAFRGNCWMSLTVNCNGTVGGCCQGGGTVQIVRVSNLLSLYIRKQQSGSVSDL